jgi:UDP-N-acetylmuramate dehydrogenase
MDALYKQLKGFGKVKLNEPLSKRTTFKIGGSAAYFIIVDTIEKTVDLLKHLDEQGIKYFIFGGGSNMLVHDEGYDGVAIHIDDKTVSIDGTSVTAAAGKLTVALAQETIKSELTEFEWGVGVPGTIGGAVRGNAGATGSEMKDNVESVEVYRDGDVITLSNKECEFGYRSSIFKRNADVVLRVTLKLQKGAKKDAMQSALAVIKYRNETQPKGYASTGCIFKNLEMTEKLREKLLQHFDESNEKIASFIKNKKIPAGWLVEVAGLKGKKVGNAQVSETHGNFIVNTGDAKAEDVLALIEEIKDTVYDRYGFELEEEIQII